MRVERGETTWTMYPTTPQEVDIFGRIAATLAPGDMFYPSDKQMRDGVEHLLISAGGEFFRYQGPSNMGYSLWSGGIQIPVIRPDDEEFTQLNATLRTSGLTYIGTTSDGGLEVFGIPCTLCGGRMLDYARCRDEVCAECQATCPHPNWDNEAIMVAADGGLAIGSECRRCKLKRAPATSDTAAVERTTGIMVVGPDHDFSGVAAIIAMGDPWNRM